MRKVSYIFLLALLLAACGGWRDGDRLLSEADGLLYSHPDSAQRLLDSIPDGDLARMSQSQRMRYELLRADAQNKRYVKFTSDSVLKEVVEYYDRKGTANERMRANYLLGRAYYDMGETPMALKYYHEAADQADTTQADCDYKLLSRVHGQMGRIFLDQDALRSAMEELENAMTFSLRCCDTVSYLLLCNQRSPILDKLNFTDSAINNSVVVSKSFLTFGQDSLAANAIGNVIGVMVRQNRLKEAKDAIRLYEEKSGLFDSVHNITNGKELYYYVKGNYYLASLKSDSSFYYFRKLIDRATSLNHLECGYHGLSRAFELTGKVDSALKYSKLAYSYNDSSHRNKITEYYTRNQNSYNFSRQQKLAEQKDHEALKVRLYWIITSLFFLTIILSTVFIIVRNRKKTLLMQMDLKNSRSELSQQTTEYDQLLLEKTTVLDNLQEIQKEHVNLEEEYLRIERAYKSLEKSKQSEIIDKEILICILETKLGQKSESSVNDRLAKASIVQDLRKQEQGCSPAMTSDQWEQLKTSVDDVFPHLSALIEEKYPNISRDEQQIVYLTKVGFKSGQSLRLLERYGATAFSMKKGRLVKKLFGLNEDGAKLFNTLIYNFG